MEVSLPRVTVPAEDFVPASRKAMELSRPVLSDAPVDDSDDKAPSQQVLPRALICEGMRKPSAASASPSEGRCDANADL